MLSRRFETGKFGQVLKGLFEGWNARSNDIIIRHLAPHRVAKNDAHARPVEFPILPVSGIIQRFAHTLERDLLNDCYLLGDIGRDPKQPRVELKSLKKSADFGVGLIGNSLVLIPKQLPVPPVLRHLDNRTATVQEVLPILGNTQCSRKPTPQPNDCDLIASARGRQRGFNGGRGADNRSGCHRGGGDVCVEQPDHRLVAAGEVNGLAGTRPYGPSHTG